MRLRPPGVHDAQSDPAGAAEARPGRGPRPTRAGWAVLAASALLVGGGWAIGHPEPVALGLAGLTATAVALLGTLPHPRLTAERRLSPSRVARGDRAGGVVSVTNHGTRPARGVVIEDCCDGSVVSVRLPVLPPGGTAQAQYLVPTNRRGNVPVGPLRLVRRDLFGLAGRTVPIGAEVSLMVHPRLHPVPVPSSGREHHLEGPTSESANEGTTTFHALRPYVQGDDLRRVHWRATARTGSLMVRQMADVSLPVTTIVLDTREDAYGGSHPNADFELAVDVAASLGHAATRDNFPLRLHAGARPALDGSSGHRVDTAALLARLTEVRRGEDGFKRAVDLLSRGGGVGVLVLVTGWADPDAARHLIGPARDYERSVVIRVGERPPGSTVTERYDVRHVSVAALADLSTLWAGAR